MEAIIEDFFNNLCCIKESILLQEDGYDLLQEDGSNILI